ncbi:hypothetical protein DL764_003560 [Monosporascus ibericus]|uniref:Uncharacterized protein n=1 Tax=Monosporascus ibericus TaxID=155417 RepID=A0A4Q4TG22_9PEZI|nr:hypothetical protein DL764_003560 [Monosporascus ibericus]
MTSISNRQKQTISNHTSEPCTHHHHSSGQICCDTCLLRTTLSLETQAIVSSIEDFIETASHHIGTLHRHEFPVPVPIPGSDHALPTPQAAEAARAYLAKRSPATMAELKLRVAVCHGEVGRAIGELRRRGRGAGGGSGEPEEEEDRVLIQDLERALENHYFSALEHARDRLWRWEESADRTAHGHLDIAFGDNAPGDDMDDGQAWYVRWYEREVLPRLAEKQRNHYRSLLGRRLNPADEREEVVVRAVRGLLKELCLGYGRR